MAKILKAFQISSLLLFGPEKTFAKNMIFDLMQLLAGILE